MRSSNLAAGGKDQKMLKADNLTAIREIVSLKTRELRRLATLWASMACYKGSFTFTALHTRT
jgi:hypothetical protein